MIKLKYYLLGILSTLITYQIHSFYDRVAHIEAYLTYLSQHLQ